MRLIPVNQKHIDAGIAEDCLRCPVALAMTDARIPCRVDTFGSWLAKEDRRFLAHGDGLRWWIDDFDDDEVATPMPTTLVMTDDDRILTLPEWQAEHRP